MFKLIASRTQQEHNKNPVAERTFKKKNQQQEEHC